MTTYAIIHRFPGATQEQYETSMKAVHPDGGESLPNGQMLHLAGPSGDGWVIMAVHESKESWERFRDGTFLPGLTNVEGGLAGEPAETTFEVSKFQTAHRSD